MHATRAMLHCLESLPTLARFTRTTTPALAGVLLLLLSATAAHATPTRPTAAISVAGPATGPVAAPPPMLLPCSNALASVSPCGVNKTVAPGGNASASFLVSNDGGIGPMTLSVTCTKPSIVTACTPSTASVHLSVGQSTTVTVNFTVGTTAGSADMEVKLSGSGVSNFGYTIGVTVPHYAVSVMPKGGDTVTVDVDSATVQDFAVHNTGSTSEVINLTKSCGAGLTCALNTASLNLAAGATDTVVLTYTATSAALGTTVSVGIHAVVSAYPSATDDGYIVVDVPSPPAAQPVVTPPSGTAQGASITAFADSQYTQIFLVRNGGGSTGTFYLTASCAVAAWDCSTSASSVELAASEDTTVSVTYTTTGTGVGGSVALGASLSSSQAPSDSGWIAVTVPVSVAVTPDSKAINYPPGEGSYTFTLSTTRPSSTSFSVSVSCPGVGAVDCYGWSDSVSASASEPASIPVTYTAGALNTSGTIHVSASQMGDAANTDSGSVQVFVLEAVQCSDAGASLSISPCQSTDTTLTDSSATRTFTVSNESATTQEYNVSCARGGLVSSCLVGAPPGSQHSITVGAHSTDTVTITYQTSSGRGTGTARLQVFNIDGYVAGTANVRVVRPVEVTPATLAVTDSAYITYVRNYTLRSYLDAATTARLHASCEHAVSCELDMDSVALNAGATASVHLTYETGKYDGPIYLVAETSMGTDTAALVSTIANANLTSDVAVIPDAQAVRARTASATESGFTIRNTGYYRATYALRVQCAGQAFATPSGCSISADSVTVVPGATTHVSVSYTTSATAGKTGTLGLSALLTRDTTVRDSTTVDLTLDAAAAPGVVILGVTALGAQLERYPCLTIRLTQSAAYECGDVRIVHAMPAVRTLNRVRAPVLVYTSQMAHPHPLLAANVTLDPSWGTPDSVIAELKIGAATFGTGRWSGSAFANGATRRIVVGFDAETTFANLDVLNVSAKYLATGVTHPLSANWSVSAIHRRHSRFGRGWSVAGVERLRFTSLTGGSDVWWEGGDGSMRYYLPVPEHPTRWWVSPSLDSPDTIKYNPTGHFYIRYTKRSGRVIFNDAGQQIATFGGGLRDTTFFFWKDSSVSATLDSIRVPGPDTATAAYRFYYNAISGSIDSIVAPGPSTTGLSRKTTFDVNARGELETITDPDGGSVGFAYSQTDSGVVTSVTERGGTETSFTFDSGQKLTNATTDMGEDEAPITVAFTPQETRGLTTPVPTDSAYTLVNGPRADTTVTKFWLDVFGEPVRVKNALGYETTYERTDQRWPALVTRVRHANGRVVKATYDTRGNVASTTDSTNQNATSRYVWSLKWDADSIAVAPEGDSIVVAYDANTGNRIWAQDARGDSTRTCFYYNSDHQLESIRTRECAAPATTFEYDTILGNIREVTTPLGFATRYLSDNVGRDTLVISPVDVAGTDSTMQRISYDLMGRVLETETIGSSNSLFVRNSYDDAGNLDTLRRWAHPNPNGIDTLRTVWSYDAANRKKTETAPDGEVDYYSYNAAGNLTAWITRRGHTINTAYDALGRQVRHIIPSVTYPQETVSGVTFPLYPNASGGGLTVPGDTVTFAYDEVGNLITANNRDAQVARQYNLDGSLRTDTLRVRTWSGSDMSSHIYGLGFEYDLDGRRTKLVHPAQLAPNNTRHGAVDYDYGVSGLLDSITGVLGYTFGFFYDAESRLDSLSLPSGMSERRFYDDDGRLSQRVLRNPHYNAGTGMADTVDRVLFTRDARGKVLMARALHDSVTNSYNGLGALIMTETQGVPINDPAHLNRRSRENFTPDAFGQQGSTSTFLGTDPTEHTTGYRYDPVSGRLTARYDSVGHQGMADTTTYDPDGNMAVLQRVEYPVSLQGWPTLVHEKSRSYYDAEGRLVTTDRPTDAPATDETLLSRAYGGVYQDYRYDALGRRVLMRTRRDSSTYPSGSTIERFVWDGSELLYEIHYPGAQKLNLSDLEHDTTTTWEEPRMCGHTKFPPCGGDPSHSDTLYYPFSGRVAYTYGSEIDAPLSVIRTGYGQDSVLFAPFAVIPLTNWRGAYAFGFAANSGTQLQIQPMMWIDEDMPSDTLDLLTLDWPALDQSAYHNRSPRGDPPLWFGNMLDGQRDASGLQYMRNRYYDPVAGQFTQEDPIGLAGGLNLYGYANGDPVSLSDPFGLCPGKLGSGDICLDFFIGTNTTLYGALRGDGRGFQTTSNPSQSRAYAIIDPSSGNAQTHVNSSCWGGGSGCESSVNSAADFTVKPDGHGGFKVHVDIVNSKIAGPHINADFAIAPDGNGGYTISGTRDGYPSFEAYYYRKDGSVQTIIQQQEGKPRQLWGNSDTKIPEEE